MADTTRRPRKSRREIDISTPGSGPKMGWRGNAVLWGTILTLFVLLYYFDFPYWLVFASIPFIILVLAGWIVWVAVVRRGAFTWMRTAMKPAHLMAKGDTAGAQQAYTEAIARVRRFAPDDHRRGIMLCELAMFVKHQGRMTEALEMYEESMTILAKDAARQPMDYFVGLNNYGICFIHLKDYEAAQRMLEKAVDMILTTRKREAGQSVLIGLKHVQALEFVLHLNLAFMFLEMHEPREAELHLRDADALAPLLSPKLRQQWHDHYIAMCALWEFEAGNFANAEKELDTATNPEYPACLRIRARLAMVRQEHGKAVKLLRKYQAEEKKRGTLHRPDLLRAAIDFAEALHGDGKHTEAIEAFEEARSIAADFKVPSDADWGKMLEQWLPRVRAAKRTDLADLMATEIAQITTSPNKAITILDKFKRHEGKA